jgi:hypothetical protein
MDAHPYPNGANLVVDLDGLRRGDGARRAREDREECISLRVDLAADMLGEGSPDHVAVVGEEVGVFVAALMKEAG